MAAYYNEIDPFAAQWLRNLIRAGLIADGVVDERSIEDIHPIELHEFHQCHFFAGIGGWSYALRLAGVRDDERVWTGSCPCQPFSAAGKGAGFADERHLWPAFFHLIQECRPAVVFGEQVAYKDGLVWLDLVRADLEASSYGLGAADLCAAGVGAPHIRQRLYWVADSSGDRWGQSGRDTARSADAAGERPAVELRDGGALGRLAHDDDDGQHRQSGLRLRRADVHDADGRGPVSGFWSPADWIPCRDGKWRPVEPGAFPLAHGVPNRVGRLRGYGNAIVPQVAAAFIAAFYETLHN